MKVMIFIQNTDTHNEGTAVKFTGSYLDFSHKTIKKLALVFGSLNDVN